MVNVCLVEKANENKKKVKEVHVLAVIKPSMSYRAKSFVNLGFNKEEKANFLMVILIKFD